ncbi:MAG TPA: hypothetical protein PLR06_01160 [Cyclobacteriaceae bacterium]|nr:hypothetical protein [Cyclobacteriaceae bacterium]
MLKRLLFSALMLTFACHAASALDGSQVLKQADSLYAQHQYTQAFDLYQQLYQGNQYSPATLLKMAHIEEGLGRLGESLYYLNIYFLTTDDRQALKKMEELAKKNNLEGYETSETTRVLTWFRENYASLAISFAGTSLFLLALAYYQKKKQYPSAAFTGVLFAMILTALLIHVNFTRAGLRGIVSDPQTYLMSGPSGGASVVAIIGEGHQLEIDGKQDVWYRVRWKEKEVWVKEGRLRTIEM